MKHDNHSEQQLEQVVDKLCKQQPLRKAPSDLYQRVMREVQLRKALPWWRKSFLHWPLSLQVLFVVAALITAKLALSITEWIGSHWVSATEATRSLPLVEGASTVLNVGNSVSSHLASVVPVTWMYGAAMVIVVLYLVLFGIGVTTYKTLYATR